GSQISMNYRIIGLNSHRSPVGSDRIRHIALLGESVTESEGEIIISVSVFGVNCKGLPEIDNSVIQLPFFHQDVAEIIIGLGIIGVDFKGLSEMNNSLIQLPLFHQSVAEIALDKRIVRGVGESVSP